MNQFNSNQNRQMLTYLYRYTSGILREQRRCTRQDKKFRMCLVDDGSGLRPAPLPCTKDDGHQVEGTPTRRRIHTGTRKLIRALARGQFGEWGCYFFNRRGKWILDAAHRVHVRPAAAVAPRHVSRCCWFPNTLAGSNRNAASS